jgi:2-polyprenyl-6-methoxyphenol hydroxylase-like FAD-dependent oxidoreductase
LDDQLKFCNQVGADGANSPVRNFASINSLGWDYDTHAVVATLEMDTSRSNDTAWQRFLPTGPIAILPVCNYSDDIMCKNHAGILTLFFSQA